MLQRFCRLVKKDWILKLRPSLLLKVEVQNGSNKTNSCCYANYNTCNFASRKTCSKNKKNLIHGRDRKDVLSTGV